MAREVLRGVPLVERVIAHLGTSRELDPRPVAPALLRRLTLADGTPLPPSLRAFLAYDGAALLGEADPPSLPSPLRPSQIAAAMGLHSDVSAFDRLLPGACYLLAIVDRSDARYFLYAGKPDTAGELPVFCIDGDAALSLQAPGLDVFLADWFDAIEFDGWNDRVYGPAITEQSVLNFGGNLELEPDQVAFDDVGPDGEDDPDEEPEETTVEPPPTDGNLVAALTREFGYGEGEAQVTLAYLGSVIAATLDAGNQVQFPSLGLLTKADGRAVIVRDKKK